MRTNFVRCKVLCTHWTLQYAVQRLDSSGSKTSIINDCILVITQTVNNAMYVNFNQGYVNIKLAIISVLVYLYQLLYIFNIIYKN